MFYARAATRIPTNLPFELTGSSIDITQLEAIEPAALRQDVLRIISTSIQVGLDAFREDTTLTAPDGLDLDVSLPWDFMPTVPPVEIDACQRKRRPTSRERREIIFIYD